MPTANKADSVFCRHHDATRRYSVGISTAEATEGEDVVRQSPALPSTDLGPGRWSWDEGDHEARTLGVLSSQELELLTGRIIPFDREDLYVLHVGVPNLVLGNESLMGKALALFAASKSHDIVRHSPELLRRPGDVRGLLCLADRRHRTSLHHRQVAVYHVQQYHHVLANAGYCIRVSLEQTAKWCGVMSGD